MSRKTIILTMYDFIPVQSEGTPPPPPLQMIGGISFPEKRLCDRTLGGFLTTV